MKIAIRVILVLVLGVVGFLVYKHPMDVLRFCGIGLLTLVAFAALHVIADAIHKFKEDPDKFPWVPKILFPLQFLAMVICLAITVPLNWASIILLGIPILVLLFGTITVVVGVEKVDLWFTPAKKNPV